MKHEYITPVNPNSSSRTTRTLNYLYDVAGEGIICGQHTQTNPMEEIEYIYQKTGHKPCLRGFELLSYSPNINYDDASKECLDEIYDNQHTLDTAYMWGMSGGGLLTFSFHWFSPVGGQDKSFYTKNTDFDPTKVLIEGTFERKAFFDDMDHIATLLKRFCDSDIPILWRPFHESDGDWFWWGSKGPVVAKELYILMFNHFTKVHHLNNLIWVWNCRLKEGYPGDEYVDVISVDIYLPEYESTDYAKEYYELINNTTKNKVCALAEVGYNPDIKKLKESHIPWAYYMTWSKEFILTEQYNSIQSLKDMYLDDYSIKDFSGI